MARESHGPYNMKVKATLSAKKLLSELKWKGMCATEYIYDEIDKKYNDDLERFNFWNNSISIKETVIRAYSMANYPDEKGVLKFNIRVASPPPGSSDIPPGLMSSWTFNLKPGDKVRVFGPFGGFSPSCEINEGYITPSSAAGFGLEEKQELLPYLNKLEEAF